MISTFKNFITGLKEARDPKETIHHLENLANHPSTGKGEAEAARNRANHLRALHNIPKDKPGESIKDSSTVPFKDRLWKYSRKTYGSQAYETTGHIHRKEGNYHTQWQMKPGGTIFYGEHKSFMDAHQHLRDHGFVMQL